MNKSVAILQSNYIPWKGYFDLINSVDEFIIFDEVQYTKRDWRNRNLVKTPHGLLWLTIPVETKGKYLQRINETKIFGKSWAKKHWATVLLNYSKAKYFQDYKDIFEEIYNDNCSQYLSEINYKFLITISKILGINTPISQSTKYNSEGKRSNRLVEICLQANANEYYSGLKAKAYLDGNLFTEKGIRIKWMKYAGYPEYKQLYPPFVHEVTVLDLIFNTGPDSFKYLKTNPK